jgi:hypothetical protein
MTTPKFFFFFNTNNITFLLLWKLPNYVFYHDHDYSPFPLKKNKKQFQYEQLYTIMIGITS